jgi:DNA-binding beta-propeller fold protein YncE
MKARTRSAAILAASIMICTSTTAFADTALSGNLGLADYNSVLVDETHQQVFVTGGPSTTGVVATDYRTNRRTVINNEPGAAGLALSNDGKILYVALASGDALAAIDTTTLKETARYPTGAQTCPATLARTAGIVWFGYGCPDGWVGGIGRLDTTAIPPTVTLNQQGDTARFQHAPLLTTAVGDTGPVVAGTGDLSPATIRVYTVNTGTLTPGPAGQVVGSDLADLTLSTDGQTLYTASGSRDHIEAFTTKDLSRAGAYHTGQYPNSVAVTKDNNRIATGLRNPDTDAYLYPVGGAQPDRTLKLDDSQVLAPRGLAWANGSTRLFVITRAPNASAPTLHVLRNPAD